jgi:methyl-accepting chemotaxis protein
MFISRSVQRQLGGDPKEVAEVVNAMAAGDFSHQPAQSPQADSLLANAYQMQNRLRDMITSVKLQANQVGDMAHSLAASAHQISENVNHESDDVAGMAASIEELSVSTTHISDQGTNAKRIATNSRSNADAGAQVVNKTVAGLLETAREIESASGEVSRLGQDATHISDVVKVIKEIADQTNLLALNAAIEAARAGEQGRGFAVVADEVRKLAERTAAATSEINKMSDKIGEVAGRALNGMDKVVKTTQQGVGDAESAQTSIKNIQAGFGEVADVIDDIAMALVEQNAAATELAKSTERVSQMSEENSGAAQGLLGLANELEKKAHEVRQAVEIFKV